MVKKGKYASLKDIAQYVGVSTSLVSFVLNGKGRQHRVSEEMIKTINEAAQKLNYHPNTFAKSLREGKSRVIGVVLSDISNPFFSTIARCLEDEAQKHGYSVLFSSSDENSERRTSPSPMRVRPNSSARSGSKSVPSGRTTRR